MITRPLAQTASHSRMPGGGASPRGPPWRDRRLSDRPPSLVSPGPGRGGSARAGGRNQHRGPYIVPVRAPRRHPTGIEMPEGQPITRRAFLRRASVAAGGLALPLAPGPALGLSGPRTLTAERALGRVAGTSIVGGPPIPFRHL